MSRTLRPTRRRMPTHRDGESAIRKEGPKALPFFLRAKIGHWHVAQCQPMKRSNAVSASKTPPGQRQLPRLRRSCAQFPPTEKACCRGRFRARYPATAFANSALWQYSHALGANEVRCSWTILLTNRVPAVVRAKAGPGVSSANAQKMSRWSQAKPAAQKKKRAAGLRQNQRLSGWLIWEMGASQLFGVSSNGCGEQRLATDKQCQP
jgi:hypothetical protein